MAPQENIQPTVLYIQETYEKLTEIYLKVFL